MVFRSQHLVFPFIVMLAAGCSSGSGTSSEDTEDAGKKPTKDAGKDSGRAPSSDDDVTDDDTTVDPTEDAGAEASDDDASSDASTDDGAVGASETGSPTEAGTTSEGGTTAPGTCGGSTPHGCLAPVSGNPAGCPPQIPEQSAYYPPMSEWKGCGSVAPYADCKYASGSKAGDCVCDTGLHWLCTYP